VTRTLHVAWAMMLQAQAFIDFPNGYVESTITLASLSPLNPSPIINFFCHHKWHKLVLCKCELVVPIPTYGLEC